MIQCYVKKDYAPFLADDAPPHLLYVSKIAPEASDHPRVMHAHEDYIEIVLITSGVSEYLIHDKKQYIRQGDLIVYNSGVVHDEISGPEIRVGSYCVAIAGLHLNGMRLNALAPDEEKPIFRTGLQFDVVKELCEMMFRVLTDGTAGAEEISHYLMLSLLGAVMPIIRGTKQEETASMEPDLLGRRIKQYIDQHYAEPEINLQTISTALHMSSYYMSHVFKKMSGYSPMQYLLRRRIGEAQTLLISTNYSITRVGQLVGYDNPSYFNLQFSKHVGMSPRKYRTGYVSQIKE